MFQAKNSSLLFVQPLQGESLTSWLYRLSNSHYCDLQTYLGLEINFESIRYKDLDLMPNEFLVEEISLATSVSIGTLQTMILKKTKISGFDKLMERKFMPWVLPLVKKQINGFGLQICSSCWSNDRLAYHRVHWRLSLFFFCPECKIYLQNNCPKCNFPILYSHPDFSIFKEDPLDALRFCFQCSANLVGPSIPLSPEHENVANRIVNLLYGKVNLPCALEDYLAVLHFFTQRNYSEYLRQTDLKYLIQTRDRSRFLEVNSILRAEFIKQAYEMFDNFPEIISTTKRSHLSNKAFWLRGFVEPPEWYSLNLIH